MKHIVGMLLILISLSRVVVAADDKKSAGALHYDSGFTLSSEDKKYEMKLNGRFQGRASYEYNTNKKDHDLGLSLPYARVLLRGHAIDARYQYGVQVGMDNAKFELKDFYGDFAVLPFGAHVKVGRFYGQQSWLEGIATNGQSFNGRTVVYNQFELGTVTGLSFHSGKNKSLSWDLGVYDNEKSRVNRISKLGAVSASLTYNHNNLDTSTEADLEGGKLRAAATLGGYIRSNLSNFSFVGFVGSLGALAKFHGLSVHAGANLGVPEAKQAEEAVNGKYVQKVTKDQLLLGAQAQVGYVLKQRYGVAAEYALLTGFENTVAQHQILAGLSWYVHNHDLKLQLDGGASISKDNKNAEVRAQIQYAF